MNVALLGVDDDVLAIANALAKVAPDATSDDEWESLLLERAVDCVIVGRRGATTDLRADQLRKLVQAKVPLIVVHPACEAIVGYEIEMIRRDVGGIIVPFVPGLRSEGVRSLATQVESDSPLGQAEQLVFERRMVHRSKEDALAQLARDVTLIREILGPIKTVSANGSLATDSVALSVQMTSERGCLARWSIEPTMDEPGATVTLVGNRGRAVCQMPANEEWSMTMPGEAERTVDRGMPTLEDLLADLTTNREPSLTWLEACRSIEVADTVPRCLARGKTIELYNEEHTEESTFKGVMAVGGCLILLLGLLMVVFVAILEGLQLPLYRFALWSNWPLYICAAFFFFLLLQLFRFVARGR